MNSCAAYASLPPDFRSTMYNHSIGLCCICCQLSSYSIVLSFVFHDLWMARASNRCHRCTVMDMASSLDRSQRFRYHFSRRIHDDRRVCSIRTWIRYWSQVHWWDTYLDLSTHWYPRAHWNRWHHHWFALHCHRIRIRFLCRNRHWIYHFELDASLQLTMMTTSICSTTNGGTHLAVRSFASLCSAHFGSATDGTTFQYSLSPFCGANRKRNEIQLEKKIVFKFSFQDAMQILSFNLIRLW